MRHRRLAALAIASALTVSTVTAPPAQANPVTELYEQWVQLSSIGVPLPEGSSISELRFTFVPRPLYPLFVLSSLSSLLP